MTDMLSLEEAATVLGRSVRTVQRQVASGKLRSEIRNGRTLVEVARPSPAALEALQRNVEATGQVAALAAVTGERASIAYQERSAELEIRVTEARRTAMAWRVAAVVAASISVATSVAMSSATAEARVTRDTMTDMRLQLKSSEEARARLEKALAGVTAHDVLTAIDAGLALAEDDCPE